MARDQDKIIPRHEPEVLRAMAKHGKDPLDLTSYAITPLQDTQDTPDKTTVWLRRGVIALTAFALAAIGYHNHADDNGPYDQTQATHSVLRTGIIDRTNDPSPSINP